MKPYERAISTRLNKLAGVKETTKKNKLRSSDTTKLNTFKSK